MIILRLAFWLLFLLPFRDTIAAPTSEKPSTKSETAVAHFNGRDITRLELALDQSTLSRIKSDVNDKELSSVLLKAESQKLRAIIFGGLLEAYAKDNNLEPTDKEIQRFIDGSKKADELTAQEDIKRKASLEKKISDNSINDDKKRELQQELTSINEVIRIKHEGAKFSKDHSEEHNKIQRQIAYSFVSTWKINLSLFVKYGGRIIFQQAGPEPIDAYKKFLQDAELRGTFKILDSSLVPGFWEYFTRDSMHNFLPDMEGKKAIENPWWTLN